MPFLKEIRFNRAGLSGEALGRFPFDIPSMASLDKISFESNVTFFIGNNGSGKSTLLEAIAELCGFSTTGGQYALLNRESDDHSLSSVLKLSWLPKVNKGFFFRAETFDAYADYIDELSKEPGVGHSAFAPYGGKSLNEQSHGQAFLSLFTNRFGSKGIYLLDEPEAALSPQNQLAFLRVMWDLERGNHAQFIIATHSPILMAYPGAALFDFDSAPLRTIGYEETEHYRLTKDFLNNRERYFRTLFDA